MQLIVILQVVIGFVKVKSRMQYLNDAAAQGVDFVVDGGLRIADPSTVVDMTGTKPLLLRRGKVCFSFISYCMNVRSDSMVEGCGISKVCFWLDAYHS